MSHFKLLVSRSNIAILALLVAGCSMSAGGGVGTLHPLDRPTMRALVDGHDAARHGVLPVVDPPLTSLAWTEPLAEIARSYAVGCRFRHNSQRGPVGENLFATTVMDPRKAAEQAVASWVAERGDYDYAKNHCVGERIGKIRAVFSNDR